MPENEEKELQQSTPYDEATKDPDQVSENEVGESGEAGADKQGETTANEGKDETPKQSRADNARFAQQRREAEAKEKAEKETQERLQKKAELQGYIQGSGGKNTYIDQPIEDEEDKHLYELMKKADADGLDPVKDGYRLLREERLKAKEALAKQEAESKAEVEARQKSVEQATENIRELAKAHPECDNAWFKKQWNENPKFKDLLLHGYTPLQAYDFLGMKAEGKKEEPKDKTPTLTPSGQGSGRKAVKDMTVDEVERYLKESFGGY